MTGPTRDDLVSESVQSLLDEREITQALHRYCRGTDRGDAELLRTVYLPDAWEDHGDTYRGPAAGFIDMVVQLSNERFRSTSHLLHNILIDLDGDAAKAESHCVARHVYEGENGLTLMSFGCRYLDRFARSADGWRISHRVVIREWQSVQPLLDDADQAAGYLTGARNRTDLVYADELPRRAATDLVG